MLAIVRIGKFQQGLHQLVEAVREFLFFETRLTFFCFIIGARRRYLVSLPKRQLFPVTVVRAQVEAGPSERWILKKAQHQYQCE